ncbi:hypothetical protein ACIBCM_06165 [Streptomyces sp. NPDC051018]|uniref:hypothetical protein n=1 Tax=Streptomyces sp. NPDC051018 TaxID=3365639 RepID=UPI003791247C
MRHGSRAAGAATLLVLLLAGCGSGPGTGQPGEGSAPATLAPAPPTRPGNALPLDAYLPSPEEQARSDRAQATLERACLTRYGLRWEGPDALALETGGRMVLSERATRFGVVDPRQAERYGYHAPDWSTHNPRVRKLLARHADVPRDVEKVLHGTATEFADKPVPRNGCRSEAAGRLAAGAPQADRNLPGRLADEATAASARDPRLTAVLKEWRTCMTGAGHRHGYTSPYAAAHDARWQRDEAPGERELAVAAADVRCQRQAGYLPVLVEVTSRYQRDLISRHTTELGRLKRLKDVRARNVAEALSTRP